MHYFTNMKKRYNKNKTRTHADHSGSTSSSRTRPDLARMALALDWIRIKLSLPKRSQSTLDFGELVMMISHLANNKRKHYMLPTPQAL